MHPGRPSLSTLAKKKKKRQSGKKIQTWRSDKIPHAPNL